jgi:3-methyl-2-oxobutanoate hydroxymethyltransferase
MTVRAKLTPSSLRQLKSDGEKIFAAICYDYQMARIADRAGADMLTVGDSVGHNFWGHPTQFEVTLEEMILVCSAVARGAERAVVTCDLPFGPVQQGVQEGLAACIRLVKEGRAEMVKIDNAIANLDTVKAVLNAGIPVFPQFGFSPQSTMAIGNFNNRSDDAVKAAKERLVKEAQLLEKLGCSALDCTAVTPDIYAAISAATSLPVMGGAATKEADGKIGGFSYRAETIDHDTPGRVNTAKFVYESALAYIGEVKAGRY